MKDILDGYSKEEIEALAIKQLESNNKEEDILKIEKIDKEYKRHNSKTVTKAIINGATIFLCIAIVLNSDSNISNFGTEELSNLFNSIMDLVSFLPKNEILIATYTKLFDGVNQIIDKLGLMGIVLANKSIHFLLSTIKDTKKSFKIKKELLGLKAIIDEKEYEDNHIK